MGLDLIVTHVKELSTKSAALPSFHQALLPVHVVHPICCKIETLDLGVTCFKGARGKQSQLFWHLFVRARQPSTNKYSHKYEKARALTTSCDIRWLGRS